MKYLIAYSIAITALATVLTVKLNRQWDASTISKFSFVEPLPEHRATTPTLIMEERGGKFRVIAKVHNAKVEYYDDAVISRKAGN
jgi:hypothetical protein